jgi:hypothetical protein
MEVVAPPHPIFTRGMTTPARGAACATTTKVGVAVGGG